MASPAELAEQRKRRRRRWWIAGVLSVPVLLYCVGLALTYTDRYEDVPARTWQSGDFEAIAEAARQDGGDGSSGDSPLAPPSAAGTAEVPPAPPQVQQAADLWVRAVNDANPRSILHHETDGRANLYVVVGAWWLTLEPDQQVKALDSLGRHWRSFLHDAFGQWETDEGFAPGIVIVDEDGEVAHNLNGKVVIRRQPTY